jgi:hypothetical protein
MAYVPSIYHLFERIIFIRPQHPELNCFCIERGRLRPPIHPTRSTDPRLRLFSPTRGKTVASIRGCVADGRSRNRRNDCLANMVVEKRFPAAVQLAYMAGAVPYRKLVVGTLRFA